LRWDRTGRWAARATPVAAAEVVAPHPEGRSMNNLLRTLAAGYGAKKLGGGCISTILIFILLYWLLGRF
jgi:hypothetical protein